LYKMMERTLGKEETEKILEDVKKEEERWKYIVWVTEWVLNVKRGGKMKRNYLNNDYSNNNYLCVNCLGNNNIDDTNLSIKKEASSLCQFQ
jgi:hypothetical protein